MVNIVYNIGIIVSLSHGFPKCPPFILPFFGFTLN